MTTPRKNYRPVQRTNNTKVPYSVNAAELIRMAKDMPVVTGSPGASVSGIGNSYSIVNNLPQRYTIEILSGSNPYVWRSVYDDTANSWATFSDGPSGTTTNIPAYEINGNTTVGAGTYVDGWFGANYEVIYFEFQPNASGATTGGNETITGAWTFSNNVTFTGDTITLGGSGDTTTLILGQDSNDTITVTGDMGFGSTTTTATAPSGELTLPYMTVSGPPTYTGSLGDVITDGTSIYINDGSGWNDVGGTGVGTSDGYEKYASYLQVHDVDWNVAATTTTVTLLNLGANAWVDSVWARIKEGFAGVSTLTYALSLESSGESTATHTPNSMASAGTAVSTIAIGSYAGSYTNDTLFKLTMTSTGGNLSALTAGELEVYIQYRNLGIPPS